MKHGGACPSSCASLEDAAMIFKQLVDRFQRSGWLLALYGSTIRSGHGRDIDLIAVNWRERPMPPDMVLGEMFGSCPWHLQKGLLAGVESAVVRFGDAILDIQFREAPLREFQSGTPNAAGWAAQHGRG